MKYTNKYVLTKYYGYNIGYLSVYNLKISRVAKLRFLISQIKFGLWCVQWWCSSVEFKD